MIDNSVAEPNAFIQITKKNEITFFLPQAEMGQGAYTVLAMCIADELDAKWEDVFFEPAPVQELFNIPGMPMMLTGGSNSVRSRHLQMRQIGASIRQMLKNAASKYWKVPVELIHTKNATLINPKTKESLPYGFFVDVIKAMKVPEKVTLKENSELNLIGKPTKRHPKEAWAKVTGHTTFGIDVRLPNLKYAALIQPRVFGATLKSFDATAALKKPGILKVKQLPNNKIAIIAEKWWQAKEAMNDVIVEWNEGAFAKISSVDLFKEYEEQLNKECLPMRQDGDIEAAFKNAYKIVKSDFSFPFLAHAPMEPLNCTVHHQKDKAYMSMGGQFQTVYRNKCAEIYNIKTENVTYYNNYLGSSFGRRGNPQADFVVDAIYSAQNEAWPVMTLWSREDDIKMGYYRPMYKDRGEMALDKEGNILGFKAKVIGQSMTKRTMFESIMFKDGIDATHKEGLVDHHYAVASHDIRGFCPDSPIPLLWLRSVGHMQTGPLVEGIIDEAAVAMDMDPIDFRIKNLKNPRFVELLKSVAKQSNWYKREKHSGYGVGIVESFGSIVAYVVKVKVEGSDYRVENVWCAVDCGLAINPLNVENQIISAVNFSIGITKYSEITIKNGEAEQNNFYDYSVATIADAPNIQVEIINSGAQIGGMGEPGVPPFFPAIANALFDATGKRYTSYPIRLS
jgi:isoquinoline 1-oxidoreductase beta subunit